MAKKKPSRSKILRHGRGHPLNSKNSHKVIKPTKIPSQKPKTCAPATKAHLSEAQSAKTTIPFGRDHTILLIGEGNFSHAHSLLEHHTFTFLTATCYDSRSELHEKHAQARAHIAALNHEGQEILYSVDARKLQETLTRERRKLVKDLRHGNGDIESLDPGDRPRHYHRILFNFPHVGGLSTDVNRQARANQSLLVDFFSAAKPLLVSPAGSSSRPGPIEGDEQPGQVVITLFSSYPYSLWNIRDLARSQGYRLVTSFAFPWHAYPGYVHARTLGNLKGEGAWKGEERDARSFVFEVGDHYIVEDDNRQAQIDDGEDSP